jgi:hypothetical protein
VGPGSGSGGAGGIPDGTIVAHPNQRHGLGLPSGNRGAARGRMGVGGGAAPRASVAGISGGAADLPGSDVLGLSGTGVHARRRDRSEDPSLMMRHSELRGHTSGAPGLGNPFDDEDAVLLSGRDSDGGDRDGGETAVGGGGVAWRGVAWRGVAWRGVAWRGVAWRGVAWRGVASRDVA